MRFLGTYLLFGPVETVSALLRNQTSRTRLVLLLDISWSGGTREDPQLIRGGFLESIDGSAEVLCDYALGGSLDELGQEERVLLTEVAVVKDSDYQVSTCPSDMESALCVS